MLLSNRCEATNSINISQKKHNETGSYDSISQHSNLSKKNRRDFSCCTVNITVVKRIMRGWYHHQFWSTSQVWEAYAWTHCNLWHQVFFKMCVGVKYTKTQAWSLTHHYASAKTRKQWLHCSVTKGWVKTKGQWGQHCSVTSCMQLNDGDHYSEILEKVPPCYWRLDSQSHFLFRRNE